MITNVTAKDKVESYVAGVLDGTIVVGKWIRLAIERYQRDLSRQDSEGFPFHLDEEAAEKACRFFPKVLRHSKGEWAGQPFHLEPWQAFIIWNLFGWKREDDTHGFVRQSFLWLAKTGRRNWVLASHIKQQSQIMRQSQRSTARQPKKNRLWFYSTKPSTWSPRHLP